jgi:hypothetical protein
MAYSVSAPIRRLRSPGAGMPSLSAVGNLGVLEVLLRLPGGVLAHLAGDLLEALAGGGLGGLLSGLGVGHPSLLAVVGGVSTR